MAGTYFYNSGGKKLNASNFNKKFLLCEVGSEFSEKDGIDHDVLINPKTLHYANTTHEMVLSLTELGISVADGNIITVKHNMNIKKNSKIVLLNDLDTTYNIDSIIRDDSNAVIPYDILKLVANTRRYRVARK